MPRRVTSSKRKIARSSSAGVGRVRQWASQFLAHFHLRASRAGSPTPIADEPAATLLTPVTKVRGVADWAAPSRVGDRDGIKLAPLALQHKMCVIDIDLRGTTGCWPR